MFLRNCLFGSYFTFSWTIPFKIWRQDPPQDHDWFESVCWQLAQGIWNLLETRGMAPGLARSWKIFHLFLFVFSSYFFLCLCRNCSLMKMMVRINLVNQSCDPYWFFGSLVCTWCQLCFLCSFCKLLVEYPLVSCTVLYCWRLSHGHWGARLFILLIHLVSEDDSIPWLNGWWSRVVHGWCTGGARVVHGWCTGGARVVHGWCTGGARVVHGWCTGGARVVPCYLAGSLNIKRWKPHQRA